MIKSITIERFKNIQKVTLPLDEITVLVGSNNSGKSSILQSIQFAVSIAQTTSLEEFRKTKWKRNKFSTSLTPNQIIYAPIRDIYSLGYGGYLSQKNAIRVHFQKEGTSGNYANFILRKGKNKNLGIEIEGAILGEEIRKMENPYTVYVPGLSGIPAYEELKSEGIVRRAAAKGDSNNVFRNILWLLFQDQTKWAEFISDFKDVFRNLDLAVAFDVLKDEHINASIVISEKTLPIDSLGTGVLQTIQILSYIHLYKPKILILDEPDSHLHPSNQRIIAKKLCEIATRFKFQIILSTHSRHMLDALKDYASIKWVSEGNIKEQEYDFISVLLEIGALDRGDIINNGRTKCVVLTEDAINSPIKTVLEANRFVMAETDIWAYEGCSKIDTAIVLAAFIKKNAPNTKVVIHRDSDYLSSDQMNDLKAKATTAGIFMFFTNGTDIENHFLNVNHINAIYSELPAQEIIDLLDLSTNECSDKSKEIFINQRTADALKIQYEGGPKVNSGQISMSCISEYDSNKERYRHGKKVFKRLKREVANKSWAKKLIGSYYVFRRYGIVNYKTKNMGSLINETAHNR